MLSNEIVKALKGIQPPSGEEAKKNLRIRMSAQLADIESDPMTKRLLPALEHCKARLKGSVLDVGCYTGLLYHYLGKPEGYTGIDVWPEAINVAKEFAPEADFRVADAFEFDGRYDVLWCSQIIWHPRDGGTLRAMHQLSKLAKKCFFILVRHDVRGIEDQAIEVGPLNLITIGD